MCMQCRKTFGDKDLRLIDSDTKKLALEMYAEGIAARKIERLLKVSHNSNKILLRHYSFPRRSFGMQAF